LSFTKPPDPADLLTPLRTRAAVAWASWVLSIGLLWGEHRLRVIHPVSLLFVLLMVLIFGAGVGTLVRGLRQFQRGPQHLAALALTVCGVLPAALWLALGWQGIRQWRNRDVPRGTLSVLVRMAGASVMEGQARYVYPHRLETERLVMFYGNGVADPGADAEEMDQHIARLEVMTGLPRRGKIWWIRGPLLGMGRLAFYGVALGSSASPASALDRHELAHGVLYLQEYPDSDPPTLLMEGWAESQSHDSKTLATRALSERGFFSTLASNWPKMSDPERQQLLQTIADPMGVQRLLAKAVDGKGIASYLRELTELSWYHHDDGPVYGIGGAFVDFLLRRHGPQRFVELYFTCRPGTFAGECERIYDADLDELEKEFWDDVEHSASEPR
jgi:hypothetical protein